MTAADQAKVEELRSNSIPPSDAARVAAVITRVPGWKGRAHVVGALSGGTTNRNLVVDVAGERFVVRLPGPDTDLLEIDRKCERVAASRAAELGVGPEVVGLFGGCLVTRFVSGAVVQARDVAVPATLDMIAGTLRAFHATSRLPHTFDAFAVPELHRRAAESRGVAIPDSYPRLALIVGEIAMAFAVDREPMVPCHNDLLAANLLRDGHHLFLLDWEYAGMNDRAFDLGNLAVNNELDSEAEDYLVTAYHGTMSARHLARLRLMKLVSDAREAMWGVVQQSISTIDFDYGTYAGEHFDRLFANASRPDYRVWLSAAGGV